MSASKFIGSFGSPADLLTVPSLLTHSSVIQNLCISCSSLPVTITFQPRSTRSSSAGSLTLPLLLLHQMFLNRFFTDWASAAVSLNVLSPLFHWWSLWGFVTKNSFTAASPTLPPPLLHWLSLRCCFTGRRRLQRAAPLQLHREGGNTCNSPPPPNA